MCDEIVKNLYSKEDVLAVVVTFNCEPLLLDNIKSLRNQVSKIIVIDNNSKQDSKKYLELAKEYCTIIYEVENKGIPFRLNEAIDIAQKEGYKLLLTMDQDTVLALDAVGYMLDVLNNDMKVASVGPARRSRYEDKDYYYKDYLITSGNLVKVDALIDAGRYDSSLFVDMVDIDISLALRKKKYNLAISNKASMKHKVGEYEERQILGLKRKYLSHGSFRFYQIYKNLVIVEKRYIKFFPLFCIKLAITHLGDFLLIMFENDSKNKYKSAMRGMIDAYKRR